ncbi:ketoacyl-synthetase C-terminal extension domain-containing protein [Priestia megaterium]
MKFEENPHCGIGSVKSNIGHLEAGAGMAGLLKVILSMKYKKIPGNIHLKEINPYIKLEDSPFYIVKDTIDWHRLKDQDNNEIPRRAGVSSFGFGGVNAHVVLEEYTNFPTDEIEEDLNPKYLFFQQK